MQLSIMARQPEAYYCLGLALIDEAALEQYGCTRQVEGFTTAQCTLYTARYDGVVLAEDAAHFGRLFSMYF